MSDGNYSSSLKRFMAMLEENEKENAAAVKKPKKKNQQGSSLPSNTGEGSAVAAPADYFTTGDVDQLLENAKDCCGQSRGGFGR
jgi:hypothetical protein